MLASALPVEHRHLDPERRARRSRLRPDRLVDLRRHIVFAQLGPLLLFSMAGGLLADVVDRRKLLVTIAASQFVLACSLSAVVAPDQPNKVAMVVVVFLIGTGQAVFNPTYSSLLPQLVGRQDLPGAVSLPSAQMDTSRVVGPVLGASLDSTFGAPAVFHRQRWELPVRGRGTAVGAVARARAQPRRAAGVSPAHRRLPGGPHQLVVRRVLITIFTFR
jgi:MFS family permease